MKITYAEKISSKIIQPSRNWTFERFLRISKSVCFYNHSIYEKAQIVSTTQFSI